MPPPDQRAIASRVTELPETIRTESELDELLTRPSAALVEFIKTISSPLLVLGAGGKMGPTLAVLARRAADLAGHPLEVIAVSRFSDAASREWLEARGVKTASCDLLDADAVARLSDPLTRAKVGGSLGSESTALKTPTAVPGGRFSGIDWLLSVRSFGGLFVTGAPFAFVLACVTVMPNTFSKKRPEASVARTRML